MQRSAATDEWVRDTFGIDPSSYPPQGVTSPGTGVGARGKSAGAARPGATPARNAVGSPAPGSGAAVQSGPGNQDEEKKAQVAALRDERKQLQAEYDKLAAYKLPDEQAADLEATLAGVQSLLKDTSKTAAERAKDIKKYVAKAKKLHPGDKKLAATLTKVTEVAGKIGEGVAGAAEKMEKLNDMLDHVQDTLERFQKSFQISETGSAADQIKDLQAAFDDLRKLPGVGDIPGLKEMFDVYSQAIGAIAESAAKLEAEVKQRNETAEQAGDFTKASPLYLRMKSQREQLADKRKAIGEKLAAVDREIAQDSDEPAEHPRSRAEVAEQICERQCGTLGTEWRTLQARATDAEAKAAELAEMLRKDQASLVALRPELEKVKAALVANEQSSREWKAHYDQLGEADDKRTRMTEFKRSGAEAKDKVGTTAHAIERLEASVGRLSAAAQRGAEASRAARAEADKAKAAYDKCRTGVYRNALAAGDITEMPDGLTASDPPRH